MSRIGGEKAWRKSNCPLHQMLLKAKAIFGRRGSESPTCASGADGSVSAHRHDERAISLVGLVKVDSALDTARPVVNACRGRMKPDHENDVRELWSSTYASELEEGRAPSETFSPVSTAVAGAEDASIKLASALDAPTVVSGEEAPEEAAEEHDSLAGYELLEPIGSGGMGEVWSAKQRVLKREVALKLNKRPDQVLRRAVFVSEATVTANLSHPNIVPVYDLMVDSETNAFAMKRVEGQSWADVMGTDMTRMAHDGTGLYQTNDFEKHLRIFLSVCDALSFSHKKGILHNDLKPANVMVGEFGEVLLLDWGLALDASPDRRNDFVRHITTLQRPLGTPEFISPEVARGQGQEMGPWSDVYSMGAILFFLIEGISPHVGDETLEIIDNVVKGKRYGFSEEVDEELIEICTGCLQSDRTLRTQSILEVKRSLEAYTKTRQSRLLVLAGKMLMRECAGLKNQPQANPESNRQNDRLYALYVEAYSTFRQAGHLWRGNEEAREGELQAHYELALWALKRGDLGLAEAQVLSLSLEPGWKEEILSKVAVAKDARLRAKRRTRVLKNVLILTLLLIAAGVFVSFRLIQDEKQIAQENASLATTRLDNIQRLSDIELVTQYKTEANALWPALPQHVEGMKAWIASVKELVSRQDTHRTYLRTFCAEKGRQKGDGTCAFLNHVDTWEYQTFERLADDLQALREVGLTDVESRLAFAETVKGKTIDAPREAWKKVHNEVLAEPRYDGLKLTPQIGLIPLGKDPVTGLQEFAHLQSGAVPDRGSDGRLKVEEATGVVLVLVPGGSFMMGAKPPTEEAPLGSPNVDPDAKKSEGPVHKVQLKPFFMGKYEITQGQWLRFTKSNPAAYPPGRTIGGNAHDLRHPVEQVRWRDVNEMLERLDLVLPTEAQWEYGIRAGTRTVFWTGDAKETLQGGTNLSDRYCHENEGPKSWRHEDWLNDGYTVHGPVGSYRANAFGLHDMAGNVWEWVRDRQAPYSESVRPGDGFRSAAKDAPRVFRGGGFRATVIHARSAERYGLYAPEYSAYDVGARAGRAVQD
jgi:formylglycine-generating enzyme required for sulfatase activity/serine/threonine protein kinase